MCGMDFRLLIGLTLILYQVLTVGGSGTFEVELIRFANPTSRLSTGHCCDGYPEICTSECDQRFRLCLTETTSQDCSIGEEVIDGPKDSDIIEDFADSQILLEFATWKKTFELRINVTDVDSASEGNVDNYVLNLTDVNVAFNRSVAEALASVRQFTGRRSRNATVLELKITAFCDVNYYGADCSVFCIGDDSCKGHYTCGPKGEKSCLRGWQGNDCDIAIPGDVADCGYGKTRHPGEWAGLLTCNSVNQSVELSIPSITDGSSSVEGIVKLTDREYDVQGIWLGELLVLYPSQQSTPSLLTFKLERQDTTFEGDVLEGQAKCGTASLSQTSVAVEFACQNGATCIRDNPSDKNICCCAPGFAGLNCEIMVTIPTTATPSNSTTLTPRSSTIQQRQTTTPISQTSQSNMTEASTDGVTSATSTSIPANSSTETGTSATSAPATDTQATSASSISTSETSTSATSTSIPANSTTETGTSATSAPATNTPATSTSSISTPETGTSATSTPAPSSSATTTSTSAVSSSATNTLAASSAVTTTATSAVSSSATTTSAASSSATTTATSAVSSSATTTPATSSPVTSTPAVSSSATTTPATTTPATTTPATSSSAVSSSAVSSSATTTPAASSSATTTPAASSPATTTPAASSPATTTPATSSPAMSTSAVSTSTTSRSATSTIGASVPATTTEQPSMHDFNKTYSFLLNGVQDDVNETEIADAIKQLYLTQNSHHGLGATDINLNFTVQEAIGETREFIVEFRYTLTLSITLSFPLLVPTRVLQRQQILRVYTPGEYEGMVWFYLRNHFHILLEGTPPSVYQYSSIGSVLEFAWKKNISSMCQSCNLTVTVPVTEELVGVGGVSITKVYYFIHFNDVLQTPDLGAFVSVPNGIEEALRAHNLTLILYQGIVEELTRFRYHYSLTFQGHVYQESFSQIALKLQQSWTNQSQVWISCDCVNITVVRADRYITHTGVEVSKIVYFTRINGKLYSPAVFSGLTHKVLVRSITVSSPLTHSTYVILDTSTLTLYRYQLELSVYVRDVVDVSVLSTFVQRLQTAWRARLTGTNDITVVIPRVSNCIGEARSESQWVVGEEVSRLHYYLVYKGEVINPHWNQPVPQKTISEYVRNVTSTSGHLYQSYAMTREIYRKEQHYVMYVKGHVVIEELTDVISLIKNTWSTVFIGGTVTVSAGLVEEFCNTDNRDLVTGIFYILKVDGRLIDASLEYQTTFNSSHLSTLLQTSPLTYTLYTPDMTAVTLISYRNQLHVYFSQTIAPLDYKQLSVKLATGWTTLHSEVTDVQVTIARVEQLYTETRHAVWRLAYFVLQKGFAVYPLHLPKVSHRQWVSCGCLGVIGISGSVYQLFAGLTDSTDNWTPYSYHFSLTFQKQVSKLDYVRLEQSIQAGWTQTHGNVTVKILGQEEYLTISGQSVWKIIYFVSRSATFIFSQKYILPSLYIRPFDVTHLDLTFANVYGGYYFLSVVHTDVIRRYSYAFTFYSNYIISEVNTGKFITAIRQVICRQVTVINDCGDILPVIVKQEAQFSSGRLQLGVKFYLSYKGKTVNSVTWPRLNTTSLEEYVREVANITTETGFNYVLTPTLAAGTYDYRYHFGLFMKTKVDSADFKKFENSIKQTWITMHAEYVNCGCVNVVVDNIEELLTDSGEKNWKLVYYLNVNGTLISPWETKPLNLTLLSHHVTFSGPQGHYVILRENSFNFNAYDFRYSNALYLHTWVSRLDYHHFEKVLKEHYLSRWTGTITDSDIHVKISGVRQTTAPDGRLVWRLVYFVRLKDKLVYPEYLPTVSYAHLSSTINFTTPTGGSYVLFSGNLKHLWPSSTFFHFYLNHPVATGVWAQLRAAVTQYLYVQYKEPQTCDCIHIEFPKHQIEFIKENGESVWRIGYRVRYNWKLLDPETRPFPSAQGLQDKISFSGPNGIKYKTSVQAGKTVMAQSVFSVFLNHYVSAESLEAVKMSIKQTWLTLRPGLDTSNLRIAFIRQKEYIDINGHSRWRFEYTVQHNNTVIHYGDWQNINVSVLYSHLRNVQTPNGDLYQAFSKEHVEVIEYKQQFSLYSTTKVATESYTELRTRLVAAWEETNSAWKACSCLEIANVRQEEVLDHNGQSVWKMVYTLKVNGTHVDATLIDNLGPTVLQTKLLMTGPRDPYQFVVHDRVTEETYTRYGYSFSFHLTNKLDVKNVAVVQTLLAELIRDNLTDVDSNVTISIQKQEEYLDEFGKTVWKVVCFAKQRGQYLPTSALPVLQHTELSTKLSGLRGPQGQAFSVVSATSLLQYRYHFSVYLTSRVATARYAQFESVILQAWRETREDYNNCSCLSVNVVSQEEVVNTEGVSFWKLVYFLRVHDTLVESLTSVDVNFTSLTELVSTVLRPTGQAYQTVELVDHSVIRTVFTHSVYLSTEIRLFDIKHVSTALKVYWQSVYPEWLSCNCLDVSVNRQQSFLISKEEKWTSVWSVEYVISINEVYVDRQTIYAVNVSRLQEAFTSVGRSYTLTEVTSQELVEYRWHFPLYISRQVKETDFTYFEEIIDKVWSTSTSSVVYTVTVPSQEEVVGEKGTSLWKLVVFIQNGTTFLDSAVSSQINTSEVIRKLNEMKVTGARGSYDVVSITTSTVLQRYDVMFPLYLTKHVYAGDIVHIQQTLVNIWETTYKEVYTDFHLDVEIVRQEDFISITGHEASKLVYVLRNNDTIQSSTRSPNLNLTDVQAKLQASLLTTRYSVVTNVAHLVRYEEHFKVTFTKPLLQADRVLFESQLEDAWAASKNVSLTDVSVTVTSQEEIIAMETTQSVSLWRVLFLVQYEGEVISAVLETDVTNSSLHETLNITRNATDVVYAELLYTGDTSVYTVYKQLFAVHFEQKTAVESFTSIATSIETAWKNATNKSVSVKIIGQEKIYSARRYVWKLTYSVSQSSETLRSDMIRGPDVETFQQHIVISSAFGNLYEVVTVSEERRVSYSLSILLDKKIGITLQETFVYSLKVVWAKAHGVAVDQVEIEFQGYERFLDEDGTSVWRHVCFVSVNGQIVNSREYRQLDIIEVQEELNSAYESAATYRVLDTAVGETYRDYSLQYSVYLRGRPGLSLLHELITPLLVSWVGKYSDTTGTATFQADITDRHEAVGMNGMTLTQVTYFMTLGEVPRDPLTIPAPSNQAIVRNVNSSLGIEAYVGDTSLVFEYDFLFWVDIRGHAISLDTGEVSTALTEIFQMADFVDVKLQIVKLEQYAGSYGVPVTKVSYTVRGNDTILDPELINNSIGFLIADVSFGQQWRIYQKPLYRLEVIYTLTVQVDLVKSDKVVIEKAIEESFKDNRTSSCSLCNVSVSIVNGRTQLTETGIRLTNIAYTVQMENRQLESWKDVQPETQVLQHYLRQSDRRFEVWTKQAYSLETLYLVSSTTVTVESVRTALTSAWGYFFNGTTTVNVTEDRSYVDSDWSAVVRIDFTVGLNGTIPTSEIHAKPTGSHFKAALQTEKLVMFEREVRKLRRMYVKGERANVTEDNLHTAIVSSWLEHNPELNKTDLAVVIKPEAKRQKRAVTSLPKVVDKDGKEVTVVLYTVGVNGDEPQDMFVEAPTPETIDSQLKTTTGARLCNCTPSLAHTLRVAGNLTDKDKEALKEAIKDALVAANPGLKKDDLDVNIGDVKVGKDENGVTVSDVDYTVSHNGGLPVEDLVNPSEEQMDTSLKKHGLNVPDNTKKEPKPANEDWKIIVGVVLGVAAFVLLCVAVAYVYVHKRRQKNESLSKREDGINKQNEFDKEHFSEPVNFKNPSFDSNRHPLDPFSTRSL